MQVYPDPCAAFYESADETVNLKSGVTKQGGHTRLRGRLIKIPSHILNVSIIVSQYLKRSLVISDPPQRRADTHRGNNENATRKIRRKAEGWTASWFSLIQTIYSYGRFPSPGTTVRVCDLASG